MSHNKIKVGNQFPNTNGEISVDINHLSDVSASSPSSHDVLKHSSGDWVSSSAGLESSKELAYSFTAPFTSTYSGGSGNYSLTNVKLRRFIWRYQGGTITQNGVNHLAIERPSSGSWRNGFEFVSTGTYVIFMSLQHLGTGDAVWQFYDETNSVFFGSKFRMSATGDKMPLIVGVITTTTANQEASLRLVSITTPSAIGNPAEMRAVSVNVYKI